MGVWLVHGRVGRGRSIAVVAGVVMVVAGCNLGTPPVKYPGFGGDLDVADVNGDGHVDVVTCAGVMLGDGTGAFPTSDPDVPLGCGLDVIDATTGDVDGDGHVDRVVVSNLGGDTRISLFPGDGTGGFGAEVWALSDIFMLPSAVGVGDVNGDDRTDIVFETFQDAEVPQGIHVLFGVDGPERFAAPVSYDDDFAPGPFEPQSLVVRDVDGDSDLDVVTVGYTIPARHEAGWVVVSLNDGTGAFPTPTRYPVTLGGGRFSSADVGGPAIVDVDDDGALDVVATAVYSGDTGAGICLAVLRGDGSGGFGPRECLLAPDKAYGQLGEDHNTGDFDHDGDTDLLTTSGVLESDGNGGFPTIRGLGGGDDAVTGDFDRDGRPDVAQSANSEGTQAAVNIFLNRL